MVWAWRDAESRRRHELSQGRLGKALAAIERPMLEKKNLQNHPKARTWSLNHRRQMRLMRWIEFRMVRWREAHPPPAVNVSVKDLERMADACQLAHQYDAWGKDCSFDLQGFFHTGGITGEEHERERWWVDRLHQILERAQLLETVVPGLCDDPLLDEQGVSESQSGVSRVGRWAKRIGSALAGATSPATSEPTKSSMDAAERAENEGVADKFGDNATSHDWMTVGQAAEFLVKESVEYGMNYHIARNRINAHCRSHSHPRRRIRMKPASKGQPKLVLRGDVSEYALWLREKNLDKCDPNRCDL